MSLRSSLMRKVKLVIFCSNGNTYRYITDVDTAISIQEQFIDSISSQKAVSLVFTVAVDDVDSNSINACFDSDSIVRIDILEIKGL